MGHSLRHLDLRRRLGCSDHKCRLAGVLGQVAVVALLMALYLVGLGSPESGSHPDERYYLALSAEMHERGAWLTPTLDGMPIWYKPPLLYWAEKICYAVLGKSLFAGRLPAGLAAMILALVLGFFAQEAYGGAARLPALLLTATTIGVLKFGRLAMMDVPMALMLTVSAWGVWRASERQKKYSFLMAGLGIGLACLLKGPVAAVIAVGAFGAFLALRHRKLLTSPWLWGGALIAVAVALPWYLIALRVHGQAFFNAFFMGENIERFRIPWTWSAQWKLIWGFVVFLLPWLPLSIGAIRKRVWDDSTVLLALLWIGVTLLVFTIPGHKYQHYGLACTPAALLMAVRPNPPRWALLITGVLLIVAGAAIVFMLRFSLGHVATLSLTMVAVLAVVAGALVIRSRVEAGAIALAIAVALAMGLVFPAVNPERIPREVLRDLGSKPLFIFDAPPGMLQLLAERKVRRVSSGSEVETALHNGGAVVIAQSDCARINQQTDRTYALAQWSRFKRSMAARDAMRAWWSGDLQALQEQVLVLAASK